MPCSMPKRRQGRISRIPESVSALIDFTEQLYVMIPYKRDSKGIVSLWQGYGVSLLRKLIAQRTVFPH